MPMTIPMPTQSGDELAFKVFYDLMARKINDILLVSSPYDAFIMEEDGRLAERIIHEYRGLNLSRPPKINWVCTAQEALQALSRKPFDMVITMPHLDDMDAPSLGREIKKLYAELPVFLMTHSSGVILQNARYADRRAFDRLFVWCGNTDLLLALIKNVEDRMNVAFDTEHAKVRVIILVEDSPLYRSTILPLLYREIVLQTQAVMEESVNEQHRILRMRARPKILLAENFEEAEELYRRYNPYLLSIFTDVRFPRQGRLNARAGFEFIEQVKQTTPDLPLLVLSSEEDNRAEAQQLPAVFINKNSNSLNADIRRFFLEYLGFGDFVFRMPNGREVGRAASLRDMQKMLHSIPDESVFFHASRNDFSSWLMARSEIQMASRLRRIKATDFPTVVSMKDHLVSCILERRKGRQRGLISDFIPEAFDPETDFVKIGKGSLGGKARGLAFVSTLLKQNPEFQEKYPQLTILVPKVLVISTEGFDAFVAENNLKHLPVENLSDAEIAALFLAARLPEWLQHYLEVYLSHVSFPLAVRSSSLLEDAQHRPCAGIYFTYMIPNNDPDVKVRLAQLEQVVKLVYASTYMETPRAYARSNSMFRTEDEKMGVIIQQLIGRRQEDLFYPAFSGVAQSYNFYPLNHMKAEEGIAHVALGLGKTVVEGGTALRFSPRYPQFTPQFSTVDDILKNAQRFFYALRLDRFPETLGDRDDATLEKLEVDDALSHPPVQWLSSTYFPEENRIRDFFQESGYPVITFARILKHAAIPLPELLVDMLEMGRRGMGSPVEIEFAVNQPAAPGQKPEFALLQIRPMTVCQQHLDLEITISEMEAALLYTDNCLGSSKHQPITDIVYVKPDVFEPAYTPEVALEVGRMNKLLLQEKRQYLLIGPGRWGTADRWLGIPVAWHDISGVSAIVEAASAKMQADPSQGSHFFHNITSLDIAYLTLSRNSQDFIRWEWLAELPTVNETTWLRHVQAPQPLILKIDGRRARAILLPEDAVSKDDTCQLADNLI